MSETPSYLTIKQFSAKHPAFPMGGMRHRILFAPTNGLAESGAIVRNGRRVLIHEQKFFDWVEASNKTKTGA